MLQPKLVVVLYARYHLVTITTVVHGMSLDLDVLYRDAKLSTLQTTSMIYVYTYDVFFIIPI